ncbi:hypothetical protein E2P79_15135 [Aeromonas schubertii]|nr:hypothetical protein E2P79_15135 [Aeromonas schubertii]
MCGGTTDPLNEPRESAQRTTCRGKAFLVTSWASKKSLATARRAGETPSRRNSSRPMRRSRIKGLAIGKELG